MEFRKAAIERARVALSKVRIAQKNAAGLKSQEDPVVNTILEAQYDIIQLVKELGINDVEELLISVIE